jgi:hypothetical protein
LMSERVSGRWMSPVGQEGTRFHLKDKHCNTLIAPHFS